MQGIQMCCVTPELQGGVRNRQTQGGCTYFGSAGTQVELVLAQEQMKSQKQAPNQGLQLGTNQGQAHWVGDLVTSMWLGVEVGSEISSGDRGQQRRSHSGCPFSPVLDNGPRATKRAPGGALSTAGRGKGMHQGAEER